MIFLKTQEEIELLRESNQLVGKTLGEVSKHIRPGISTLELDKIAEDFIRSNGGIPGFLGYGGFPNTLCISVNDEVVHGIPSSRRLEEGDVVSVDCGVVKNGFYGDSAYTFAVGEISDEVKKLLQVTKDSLYKGIEQAVAGMRIGDIGYAVQSYAVPNGFSGLLVYNKDNRRFGYLLINNILEFCICKFTSRLCSFADPDIIFAKSRFP